MLKNNNPWSITESKATWINLLLLFLNRAHVSEAIKYKESSAARIMEFSITKFLGVQSATIGLWINIRMSLKTLYIYILHTYLASIYICIKPVPYSYTRFFMAPKICVISCTLLFFVMFLLIIGNWFKGS